MLVAVSGVGRGKGKQREGKGSIENKFEARTTHYSSDISPFSEHMQSWCHANTSKVNNFNHKLCSVEKKDI